MRKLVRCGAWVLLGLAAVVTAMVLLLRHPALLFAYAVERDGLSLYSDRPFAPEDGRKVLAEVREKLARSTLYTADRHDAAFLCHSRWRWLIYGAGNYRASGLNYAPITTNVFLVGGDVKANRLISSSGRVVSGQLTLASYIAHEMAHTLTLERVGVLRYYTRVPAWLKEAYADRIARGSVWSRPGVREAFLAEAPEMNWPPPAPYLRYNLLLACLLEGEGLSFDEVFAPGVSQEDAEARLKRYDREHRASPH